MQVLCLTALFFELNITELTAMLALGSSFLGVPIPFEANVRGGRRPDKEGVGLVDADTAVLSFLR